MQDFDWISIKEVMLLLKVITCFSYIS